MTHSTELVHCLQAHLPWHKARVKFLAQFMIALIKVSSVSFAKLSLALNADAQAASNYRRIQRFFALFSFEENTLTRLFVHLLPIEGPFTLSVDRTNWQFGTLDINILMIGVVHQGMAFPLMWTLLDKRGNSNTKERIALLKRLFEVVPPREIKALVADREFIGQAWFAFLKQHHISFYIRIRENMRVQKSARPTKRGSCTAKALFRSIPIGFRHRLKGSRWICGHKLRLVGIKYRSRKGKIELLLVVTNVTLRGAVSTYRKRWDIETLFGAFKSRGFNLESTHLRDLNRLSKLVALLSLGFIWAYRTGQWRSRHVKRLPVKKHGYRAQSVFRYGLDYLQEIVLNLPSREAAFKRVLQLIIAPLRRAGMKLVTPSESFVV